MTKSLKLVSSWLGTPPTWLERVMENHSAYARRHGYGINFEIVTTNSDPKAIAKFVGRKGIPRHEVTKSESLVSPPPPKLPTFMMDSLWRKVELARETLNDQSNSYVFLSDCDSVFMNFSTDFNDLIDMDKSLIFTGDAWDLYNGGHLFIRNTSFARDFLDLWLSFKSVRFPSFPTTHQSITGQLSDQPVMNAILNGGTDISNDDFLRCFNSTNGFVGNTFRKHKLFPYTHAPTNNYRLPMANSLIHKSLRPFVRAIGQTRLNSYEMRLPGSKRFKLGDPIIHLVGRKNSVIRFCEKSRDINGT